MTTNQKQRCGLGALGALPPPSSDHQSKIAGRRGRRAFLVRLLGVVAFSTMLLSVTTTYGLMIPLTITSLVDQASCIIEGRVVAQTCRWTDDRSAIVTDVQIAATDVLLGKTNQVEFTMKGGTVGDRTMFVSDMPVMTNGQQVLIFLRDTAPGESGLVRVAAGASDGRGFTLVGRAQGLYAIQGGTARKSGFSLVGDGAGIDREVGLAGLKAVIRERLNTNKNVTTQKGEAR